MRLYLKQLEIGPLQNFVYLVGSLDTREAVVVDPAWDVPRILEAAAQDEMRINRVLVTHTHFDHINGVEELVRKTDAQVFVHKKESAALPLSKTNLHLIEGGYSFEMGGLTFSFLHTPGHTPGSSCFTVGDRLIAGDTLFIGGCGRCDLPGGDPEALYQSLARLRQMGDRLILHPGHNYAPHPSASMGEEKSRNPFLKADSLEQFLDLVGAVKKPRG